MSQPNIGARPAYPHLEVTSKGEPYHDHLGMTIRQAYKIAALQLIDSRYTNVGNEAACAYEIARYSGIIADAMLAEDAAHENEGQQAYEKGEGA